MAGIGRFDNLFGGEPGSAQRALDGMRRTYGRKDGETVFNATVAKRKRKTKAKPFGQKGRGRR